jgi:hypothetical protein
MRGIAIRYRSCRNRLVTSIITPPTGSQVATSRTRLRAPSGKQEKIHFTCPARARAVARQPVASDNHSNGQTLQETRQTRPTLSLSGETADGGKRQPSTQKWWHGSCQHSMSRAVTNPRRKSANRHDGIHQQGDPIVPI